VEENFRNTLQDFAKRVNEPWELLFYPQYLKTVKECNYLDRAIIFPYGGVEGEPSFPLTSINFQGLRPMLETAGEAKGLLGVMANVQTFLVQLPNIFYVADSTWGGGAEDANDAAVLRSLAKLLFPQKAEALVEGWMQLKAPGSAAATMAAQRIEKLLSTGQMGRLGTIGGYIFPQPTQLPGDLVVMLRIHVAAERIHEQVAAGASERDVTQAWVSYFQEMLNWQRKCGFFGTYAVNKQVIYDAFLHGPDSRTVKAAWELYTNGRPDQQKLQSTIVGLLSTKGYTDWIVKSITGQVFGSYTVKGENNMDIP
jgi:hypothetical protein